MHWPVSPQPFLLSSSLKAPCRKSSLPLASDVCRHIVCSTTSTSSGLKHTNFLFFFFSPNTYQRPREQLWMTMTLWLIQKKNQIWKTTLQVSLSDGWTTWEGKFARRHVGEKRLWSDEADTESCLWGGKKCKKGQFRRKNLMQSGELLFSSMTMSIKPELHRNNWNDNVKVLERLIPWREETSSFYFIFVMN